MSDSRKIYQISVGRGTGLDIPNRFERVRLEHDLSELDAEDQHGFLERKVKSEYYFDHSQSIVSQNSSPDINFNFSLNPYRGCAHGCSYCYARPSHEYLGLNAGIDFESKIIVKPDAPALFRDWLNRKSWIPEPVMLSGVTDCYQGCEKVFEITRQCIEAAWEYRQPLKIITKNGLIRRDVDLLEKMAAKKLVRVTISVTSLDQGLIRVMEPRTSSPQARLDTIAELSEAGIPVHVLTAPVIPAINDDEIPNMLRAAADAGARSAGYVVLRLPHSVEPVFVDWLEQNFPDRKEKVLGRIKSLRNGQLYSSEFGQRMSGTGFWADQIRQIHQTYCRKYKLRTGVDSLDFEPLDCSQFRRLDSNGHSQRRLF